MTKKAKTRAQRIAALRKALVARYGSRKYRIVGSDSPRAWALMTETVHVYSTMPNSMIEGWWLMGDLETAEDWMGIDRT